LHHKRRSRHASRSATAVVSLDLPRAFRSFSESFRLFEPGHALLFLVQLQPFVSATLPAITLLVCLVLASSTSRPLHVAGLTVVLIAYVTGAVLETWM
jgi:hypothetical protein